MTQVSREYVRAKALCEEIEENHWTRLVFGILRTGYPDSPPEQQERGLVFRRAADEIIDKIVRMTIRMVGAKDREKFVVLVPWRAGLAFAAGYKRAGIRRFYHVSARRDERTLETKVDYEHGSLGPDDHVIIADPMLATGNTVLDAIGRVIGKGLGPHRISVNAVLAAPEGVHKVAAAYPDVWITVGTLDEKLDERGYIVPGLGDFGDKYFADFTEPEMRGLLADLNLSPEGERKLIERIESHHK